MWPCKKADKDSIPLLSFWSVLYFCIGAKKKSGRHHLIPSPYQLPVEPAEQKYKLHLWHETWYSIPLEGTVILGADWKCRLRRLPRGACNTSLVSGCAAQHFKPFPRRVYEPAEDSHIFGRDVNLSAKNDSTWMEGTMQKPTELWNLVLDACTGTSSHYKDCVLLHNYKRLLRCNVGTSYESKAILQLLLVSTSEMLRIKSDIVRGVQIAGIQKSIPTKWK